MILQNVVISDKKENRELYCEQKSDSYRENNYIVLPKGKKFSSCTYMNCFDIEAWRKYTELDSFFFFMAYSGKGKLKLVCEQRDGTKQTISQILQEGICEITLPKKFQKGLVYFELYAEEETKIYSAAFATKEKVKKECKLAIVICTYKRKQFLENILEILNQGLAINNAEEWLHITVVDNASELENSYGNSVSVFHNPNTGGSGGFSRGMDEVINNLGIFSATHVVLMDDDVRIDFESIIRLKSLLSYVKEHYVSDAVAGRMFRLDNPIVQYTALEIWNGGDLKHIGFNQDMTLKENFWSMNDNTGGEYGGWWFECYPIEFVKDNRPLPFFIHCDDVEYGLRHGGTPIILNGIQVWHETAEYRQSPVMAYYDVRNRLIVNEIYEVRQDKIQIAHWWMNTISFYHVQQMLLHEWMAILAMRDYLCGVEWCFLLNVQKKHKSLVKYKTGNRVVNAFFWRYVKRKLLGRKELRK